MKKNKVIVIGIDGGDFKIIDPLIKKGLLPNIKKIFKQSSFGPLESSILPSSEQGWSSFSTGCNNGKYGIYSFIQRENNRYSFKLVDNRFFRGKRLWDILGEHKMHSIVVNLVATYPPIKTEGIIVGCRLTPNKDVNYTYPDNIKYEIEKIAPGYIVRIPLPKISKDEVKKMSLYLEGVDKKTEQCSIVSRYLMKKYPWDMSIVVFDYTDEIQHIFWGEFMNKDERYGNVISRLYSRIDCEIGKIISEINKNTSVILLSDHGFGPFKRRINFNAWLRKEGYLVKKGEGLSNLKRAILRKIHRMLPGKIERYLKHKFFKDVFSSMVYSNVNWKKTRVFSVGSGGMCINLKGRELHGIVDPKDYKELRDELIRKIISIKDPQTNKPVVKRAYKKEGIYHGSYVGEAPDIVNFLEDGYKPDLFRVEDKIFSDEKFYTGNHAYHGFFAIMGPGIKKRRHKNNFNIIDVAPTILHLLGIPIPKHMDGKVLKEIFNENTVHNKEVPP